MSNISAGELASLATRALAGQGFPDDDAADIAHEFVIAEIAGVRTHGVGKLVSLNLGDLTAEPTIVERGAVTAVDGNGSNGFLLMRRITPLVIKKCQEHSLAAAFLHNFSRYSSLYPYTDAIARTGLVGVLMNSAGPAAVTPYGSVEPLTGTNPMCFSFPTSSGKPQTFDFATSDRVWGEIRQAALEGRGLPSGPFLDSAGDVTTIPADVNAVRAFGGPKGWALNLAIEVLAGLLTGGRAGSEVESEFDCGATLLAIDPSVTGAGTDFPAQTSKLFSAVRATQPLDEGPAVRCPGDRGRTQIVISEHLTDTLDVPDTSLELLRRMAGGEKIAELSSNPLFN